jgi:hypothetical protein
MRGHELESSRIFRLHLISCSWNPDGNRQWGRQSNVPSADIFRVAVCNGVSVVVCHFDKTPTEEIFLESSATKMKRLTDGECSR